MSTIRRPGLRVLAVSVSAAIFIVATALPGLAFAAESAPEPYSRAALWMGAVAYAALVLIVMAIAFRGRFSKRNGGGTVQEDLVRKAEERSKGGRPS